MDICKLNTSCPIIQFSYISIYHITLVSYGYKEDPCMKYSHPWRRCILLWCIQNIVHVCNFKQFLNSMIYCFTCSPSLQHVKRISLLRRCRGAYLLLTFVPSACQYSKNIHVTTIISDQRYTNVDCHPVHRLYLFHDAYHGPLARYVKLWVTHAPGMPGTFSPATAG